jgi:molecular chaperone GrpE (heat shock protein)
MKIVRFAVAAMCAACAFALMDAPRAFAHAGHSHGAANVVIPETAEGVLAEINKNHAAITAAVSGKNLKAVHDLAETMTALAKALPDKVAEEKKQAVQRTTENMIKLLDTLHHAADDGDQPRSGIELKKLDGAVNSLTNQLK